MPSIKSGLASTPFGTYLRREYILDKIFVTRNKIFMTSKNKNIMTSLILEEMEKRGRRQVFRSEDMRFALEFGLRFMQILPRRTWGLLYAGLL